MRMWHCTLQYRLVQTYGQNQKTRLLSTSSIPPVFALLFQSDLQGLKQTITRAQSELPTDASAMVLDRMFLDLQLLSYSPVWHVF